jgi:two-component system sensor histidine kinase/response regulator
MPQNQVSPDGPGAPRDPRVDRIVRLAARALGAPAAAQWNEIGGRFHLASWHGSATVGPPLDGLPLDVHGLVLLPDLALAPVATAPPLAGDLSEQRVRGYAVAPIRNPSGHRVGVLAILDVAPRAWSAADREALLEHAALIGEVVQPAPTGEPGEEQYRAFARDVTERKQAEDALRQANRAADAANRAKSAFLANMSHEIRTPLHAILGHTQLLQRDPELGKSHQLQLEVIRGSGEQLLRLMNDVLEMSRMEVGRRQLRRAGVDLWRLLDDLDRVFGAQADAKRLTFLTVRSPDLPRHIMADGGKLEQMLGALLGNAVKFTEHGTVTMRALLRRVEAGAPRMVVEVEDTGTGIGAEKLEVLFHPFAQARVGIVAQGGVGLGLAISQEIARSMDGDIAVESQVGQGSVFRLDIPIEVISTRAPEAPAPVGRVLGIVGGARLRALVVSGGREQRSWMGLLLEQVGFDVREEDHGPKVLEQLDAWQPHLVLMDVRAPAAAATATTRAIRARPGSPTTVIVALASNTFDEDRYGLTEAGADGILRRPCREGDLLEEVRARLGIQYTYSERPPSERAPAVPSLLAMRQELRRLPAPLVEELRAVAHIADSERLTALVAQIPDQGSPVTRALRVLVEQYAYDQIEAVLVDEPPPVPRSVP